VTALANSPVFWIGLLAGLGVLLRPAVIAVFRRVENIGVVVFLNCLPIAWPAALVVACMMPGRDDQ
jgi:hypothetical protein